MSKKIIFVALHDSKFGGMERRYARLAKFLKNEYDFKIKLITYEEALPAYQEINVDVHIFDLVILKKNSNFFKRSMIIQRLHNLFTKLTLFRHLIFDKPSRIFFCHNPQVLYSSLMLHYSIFRKIFQQFSSKVAVAAVSPDLDNYTESSLRILDTLKSVDALSPEIAEYIHKRNNKANVHSAPCSFTDYSSIKMSDERPIDIIMVARFDFFKGYDLLEQISSFLSDYHFQIIGFGDLKPDISGATYGTSTDVRDLLSKSKIFLSLQYYNNYPSQSLIEAMASECAVIATDVGETRLILDESNSILIDYDSDQLKSAIVKLLQDEKLRIKLGKSARKKVLAEHRIERYAEYFIENILDE